MRRLFPTFPRIGPTVHVSRAHRLANDRRGVTALALALSATVLLGLASLATEAATWYMTRQQSYNVADAAAIAAVVASSRNASASDAAMDVATQNGFADGANGVSVQVGQVSNGLQVLISQDVPLVLASLFLNADVNVAASSVAGLVQTLPACALSLSGTMTIATNLFSANCYYASNATGPNAISVPGPIIYNIYGLTTVGDCTGEYCPATDPVWAGGPVPAVFGDPVIHLHKPTASYQPVTIDAFEGVSAAYPNGTVICPANLITDGDANHCPTASAGEAVSIPDGTALLPTTPDPNVGGMSACDTGPASQCAYYGVDLTISQNATLAPGTYLLLNSSLTIGAGASVTCSSPAAACNAQFNDSQGNLLENNVGVTIILAHAPGDGPASPSAGKLVIDPAASVVLNAPDNAAGQPALKGFLFYRDPAGFASDSDQSPAVSIADGNPDVNGTQLTGAMYFPGAHAYFAANMTSAFTSLDQCAVVVAGTLYLGYQSGINPGYFAHLSTNGCYVAAPALTNSGLPTAQAARVLQ